MGDRDRKKGESFAATMGTLANPAFNRDLVAIPFLPPTGHAEIAPIAADTVLVATPPIGILRVITFASVREFVAIANLCGLELWKVRVENGIITRMVSYGSEINSAPGLDATYYKIVAPVPITLVHVDDGYWEELHCVAAAGGFGEATWRDVKLVDM